MLSRPTDIYIEMLHYYHCEIATREVRYTLCNSSLWKEKLPPFRYWHDEIKNRKFGDPFYYSIYNCGETDIEIIRKVLREMPNKDDPFNDEHDVGVTTFPEELEAAIAKAKQKNSPSAEHIASTLTKDECKLIIDFVNKTYKPIFPLKYQQFKGKVKDRSIFPGGEIPYGAHYFYFDEAPSVKMKFFNWKKGEAYRTENFNTLLNLRNHPEFKDCDPQITKVGEKLCITNPAFVVKLKTLCTKKLLTGLFKSSGPANVITGYMEEKEDKPEKIGNVTFHRS